MRCCRSLGSLCLVACFLLFAPVTGQAQDYPSRPIRLIITSPAGSLVDVLGRLVAEDLGARLGQTVVVDNRPGAMTQVGSDALNRLHPHDRHIGTDDAALSGERVPL
jgi:tripartite-type tricarboxylate transporter receptor subunit TctC